MRMIRQRRQPQSPPHHEGDQELIRSQEDAQTQSSQQQGPVPKGLVKPDAIVNCRYHDSLLTSAPKP